MEKNEDMRLLPLGVSDYRDLQRDKMYYVDKTKYISILEKTGKFLFFTRPRRFGKSLFVSMLCEYYDSLAQDRFEENFKDTWICDHPTSEKGQYQILFFDFSRIEGDFDNLEKYFNEYCCNVVEDFAQGYKDYYSEDTIQLMKESNSAIQKLNVMAMEAKRKGYKLYMIVDEYDNFTNTILTSKGRKEYEDITHGTGFYRAFLRTFKATANRSLLIGVSPIALDDLSSGANNFTNITAKPEFNMALGFSQDDVEEMIRYYQGQGVITRSVEDIIEEIKPWYDNYCFARESYGKDPMMFNSDMVLYYMSNLIDSGKSPDEMIDSNTRTDYNKMRALVGLDRWDGNRGAKLRNIVENGYIYAQLINTFPAEAVVDPEIFPSLLFYYGMLTIGGTRGSRLKLTIPNRNVMVQYYQYFLKQLQKVNHFDLSWLEEIIEGAAFDGDWRTLLEYLAKHYKEDSSVRDAVAGEKGIQIYMNAYLQLSRLFIVRPEVEMNHGFSDIFLLSNTRQYPDTKHSYIIELKYLKTDATDADAEKQWQEAVEQVKRYGSDASVHRIAASTTLHLIVMQMKGAELLRLEEID